MPAHVSILQLVTAIVFVLAAVLWAIGLVRIRRYRFEGTVRCQGGTLQGLPRQRLSGPRRESVELTPAERDAFAVLVRRLRDGRF